MKILTVCNWGKNRSRFLAQYLAGKGYETDFVGVRESSDNRITQAKVDWADKIVLVQKELVNELEDFEIDKDKLIILDVDDRMSSLSGEDWLKYQREFAYPELIRQIDEYLK